jgi:hypothetical protein
MSAKLLNQGKGVLVERDQSLAMELTEGNFEEPVVGVIGANAVVGEGEELTDSETCVSHQEQALVVRGRGGSKTLSEHDIGLGGQRAREVGRQLGEVRTPDQAVGVGAKGAVLAEPTEIGANLDENVHAGDWMQALVGEGLHPVAHEATGEAPQGNAAKVDPAVKPAQAALIASARAGFPCRLQGLDECIGNRRQSLASNPSRVRRKLKLSSTQASNPKRVGIE